ncbi:hypothetical protein TRFO_15962 [Tritrichomonas foetus]|uniref:ENTH domain-containing protein n=1 Tax=Tritrichomonas foetus TaxID=1144522 RepID=A0A1J4KWC5_9EUKA|nr:hypothetical protein TRFO_15962 [Tritrichomonas foetus]|eukprot:OHT13829.1 hypothetical protein TRFO_15962 [Tritrichomonas foetus]
MSFWQLTKQKARFTSYLFNGRNSVERYFLEATTNEEGIPTNIQKITAARLSYEIYHFQSVKNVILERLQNIQQVFSIHKSLILIQKIIKLGKKSAKSDIIYMQPILEFISCSKIFQNDKSKCEIESKNRMLSQNIIVLINNDSYYMQLRNKSKIKREKVKLLEIKILKRKTLKNANKNDDFMQDTENSGTIYDDDNHNNKDTSDNVFLCDEEETPLTPQFARNSNIAINSLVFEGNLIDKVDFSKTPSPQRNKAHPKKPHDFLKLS